MILNNKEDYKNVEDDVCSSSDEDVENEEEGAEFPELHKACVLMFKEIGISFSKFKENETGGNCNMNIRRRSKRLESISG